MTQQTDMNSFKEIFPSVKNMVLNSTSSDLGLYLQSLVDIGVISWEYYLSLLDENDIEDLCRKIALCLVESLNGCHVVIPPTCAEEETPTMSEDLSAICSESLLKLLCSDLDKDAPCGLQDTGMEDLEGMPIHDFDCKELLTDEFVSTLTTVDVTELVDYTNGVGNNSLDELLDGLSDLGECEEPESKRARRNCSLRQSPRSQKPRQKRKKKSTDTMALHGSCAGNEAPNSLSSVNLPYFFTPSGTLVGAGNICQPCSFPVVQGSHLQIIANIIVYPAPAPGSVLSCVPSTPPIPEHHALSTNTSIPPSPDRSVSCSPFAPSAADLPNSPEAASMYHCTSTEQVNTFIEAQKQHYLNSFASKKDSLYTGTILINSRIIPKTEKVVNKTAEKELLNYDLAEKERQTLELSNLFDDNDRKEMETKIIALLGQSGMGKTVLVKKICHEWSAGKFSQFSFVFYFECRYLDVSKQYSFKDLLFKLSSGAQEKNIDVYQYILRNPEKVLLIFDGFDEFQDPEGLLHGSFTTSPSKTNKVKDLFTGLFQKKLLRGCTLLITARVREKLNQYLGKVEQIVEMMGFSPSQVEWYIKEYFRERPDFSNALDWIKDYRYVFSYCYIPFVCKLMCLFAEKNLKTQNQESGLSLAALFYDLFQKNLHAPCIVEGTDIKNCTVDISCLGFESENKKSSELESQELPSETEDEVERTPSNALVQNFSTALHILDNIGDRNLVRYVSFDPKKRRNQESCPDMVRRFLIGLLFHNNGIPGSKVTKSVKNQKKMTEYFRLLQLSELCPQRLLEVLHCVDGTNNVRFMRSLDITLDKELSFVNTRLTPPDVFVLKKVLRMSEAKVSLDLRRTSIDQKGLKELVGLKSVSSFRASLSDTVNLWKMLLADGKTILLKKCIKKFTLEPFKVESLKDVTDLIALVDIQNDICNSSTNSSLDIKEIPAVENLKSLIFGLGKKHGQDGFLKLVEILPKLPALQLLDLNNLTENHIGDKGMEKLAEKFPQLRCLQALDLSQNNITGAGAMKLAAALPSLPSLQTLSLFNNNVCDMGAEELARILPDMTSLEALHLDLNSITCTGAEKLAESLQKCPKMRSLRMYSMTIPHASLQRLQQRDSRIRCLCIG
ncbi:MHC class II transactivator isoform X2 [Dendropsophus ebraccatus]|uniref:MHC class II transactivator isoform X2 n=1 Tax=Dendropsophus ebraccatus TaxID=150705 RepID=UPI0038316050